jgi:fumarate reductase subunit C
MSKGSHAYSPHHPRWYRRPVSTYWWASRGSYFAFILRELSSIFVAWFILYLLMLVRAARHGTEAYYQFLDWSAHPVIFFVNLVTFLFLLLHSITWFNLAPQAMVVKLAGKRVPGLLIAASNYAAWAFASMLAIWLLLGD